MAWVHTWLGLLLGLVLMTCFFFGTLSVFDREIDRWALPQTRFAVQPAPSFDRILKPVYARLKPDASELEAIQARVVGRLPPIEQLPMQSLYYYTTHRDPVLQIGAEFGIPNRPKDPNDDHLHVHGNATIDPRHGAFLSDDQLRIGTQFFYPLHFNLHLDWKGLGYWIVGLAALSMLVALVTGVIIHRKLLRELFTFRPHKRLQRSTLDLHNLSGVAALPFHFFFALSGLIIFANYIYLPVSEHALKPLAQQHEHIKAVQTGLPAKPAHIPAPLASVDAMVAEAKRRWAARGMSGEVGYLTITHLNDQNGYVSIFRAGSDQVGLVGQGIHFRAATGQVLQEDPQPTTITAINEFITGLHLQHFRHWVLRWLYVAGGLMGCVCIATGFIFFVEKRRQQHARQNGVGNRWVEALAVSTVTGMVCAALAILVANRMLPEYLTDKGDWEKRIFWLTWLFMLFHASWRSHSVLTGNVNRAWREQSLLIALLAVSAVMLNWVTTGDHLIKTLWLAPYMPVAGMDLSLLVTAGLAMLAAHTLSRRAARGTESAVSVTAIPPESATIPVLCQPDVPHD